MEVEEIGWVVAGLEPHQAVVVAPVIGVRPVLQVRIGEGNTRPDPHGCTSAQERVTHRCAACVAAVEAWGRPRPRA